MEHRLDGAAIRNRFVDIMTMDSHPFPMQNPLQAMPQDQAKHSTYAYGETGRCWHMQCSPNASKSLGVFGCHPHVPHRLRWRDEATEHGPPKTIYNRLTRWSRLSAIGETAAFKKTSSIPETIGICGGRVTTTGSHKAGEFSQRWRQSSQIALNFDHRQAILDQNRSSTQPI